MTERLIRRPWSLNNDAHTEVAFTVNANLCPRLILPVDAVAHWAAPIGRGVPASFPFRHQALRMHAWFLPAPNRHHDGPMDFTTSWQTDVAGGEIIQRAITGRDDTSTPVGLALGKWVRRIIRAFQELAHGDSPAAACERIATGDFHGPSIARRDWQHAKLIWLEAEGAEPRMSLIIRLAQDNRLRDASVSIARQPRQILARIRENTRMDRVREIDAACIIDYAKRPGRTPVEKAGDRQQLLAVQRIPNRDTLENRTSAWVFDALKKRSDTWKREHESAVKSGSERAKSVVRLARDSECWRKSDPILPISTAGLTHPVQPNYPLQMESRYREIMRVYRELYHEKRTEDDAWTWRRVLWAHAARQLMACALLKRSNTGSGSLYFRQEQDRGQWLLYGSSPGPVKSSRGTFDWIDAMEVDTEEWLTHPPAPWMKFIGKLGPEWLLWSDAADSTLLVWPILSAPSVPRSEADWQAVALDAAEAMTRFRNEHTPKTRIQGLILATHAGNSVEVHHMQTDSSDGAHCVLLLIPLGYDQENEHIFHPLIRDLRTGIELALDL